MKTKEMIEREKLEKQWHEEDLKIEEEKWEPEAKEREKLDGVIEYI